MSLSDICVFICPYLFTYNISFVGWVTLQGMNKPYLTNPDYFQLYESSFFTLMPQCLYFLKINF